MRDFETSLLKGPEAVLEWAFATGASDLHFGPHQHHYVVTLRLKGQLHAVGQLPNAVAKRAIQAFKASARLNIAEFRRPQDGRLDNERGQARLAVHPCLHGESLVIRLLPNLQARRLAQLGFSTQEIAALLALVSPEEGLTLVAGPTGSGKTTTLHGLLSELDRAAGQTLTLEDPVEILSNAARQTDLSALPHLSFAEGLKSLMRQDPDTLLIGEIRDRETAELTLNAALTGHRVLASIHAPDCLGALARLVELGISLRSLLVALNGVVHQRLSHQAEGVRVRLNVLNLLCYPRAKVLAVQTLADLHQLALTCPESVND